MATKAFVSTFQEQSVTTNFYDPDDYTDVSARRQRYAIYWAMYENTAYRNIHKWAQPYRAQYGLYKYIRNIHNPSYRLGEFWTSHLMGGMLDPLAGTDGALPIITENERLRQPIARLWRDSNWQANKDIWTLNGSILGDAVLRVCDDTEHKKVYLEVIHPGELTECAFDQRGNVRGYRIDRPMGHPEGKTEEVVYTEIAVNEGGLIHYQTMLNGTLYPWNGTAAEWDEEYGFVPMVVVQHHNVGLNWGWSEIHPMRSKMHEADDLASMMSDQIRKTVNPAWLFAGVANPATAPAPRGAAATTARPQPGREETPALYTPEANAKAQALVAPIDWAGAAAHLSSILAAIEGDYPELRFESLRLAGDLSGEALRIARQPAEDKVRARRAGYDDGVKRAQQMAVAIGGYRGYEAYQGFGLDSYAAGDLEHSIGDRAVFGSDELQQLAEDNAFWTAAGAAVNAGMPLEGYLLKAGWSPEDIRLYLYSGVPTQ